jgi:competence protein ComEA
MKKIWDKYFYWNRTERRGVLPLLVLVLVLIGANLFIRSRSADYVSSPDAEFLARAKEFGDKKNQWAKNDSSGLNPKNNYAESDDGFPSQKSRFRRPAKPFNPNDLSKAEWMNLGLSEKQAAGIARFQGKGGKFYKKEDLKKSYVISEAFYTTVEPFLVFPEKEPRTSYPQKKDGDKFFVPLAKTDINEADSVQLTSLKGITPKMAQKILAVRKMFGGFHSLEQVKDLHGFFEPNYTKFSEMAFAGTITITPINLNYCTFKDLLQVPGLNYDLVKTIINHRERNGSFKKTEDLMALNLAEPDLYAKIAPYLTVK